MRCVHSRQQICLYWAAVLIPTLVALTYLMSVSSMWPIGPLVLMKSRLHAWQPFNHQVVFCHLFVVKMLSNNNNNNKKRSHTQLDSRKQVIAFQDRVMTINIKEAQHPLKWEKQVIDKSSIMLKISTRSMHRVLVWEIGPANNTTRCSRLSKRRLLHAWHPSQLAINLSIDKSKW